MPCPNLGLFLNRLRRIPKAKQAIVAARNVRVFGSVARGAARPDSDVDVLVELEAGRRLLDLGGLLMDLQDLPGRQVDVVTEPGLRDRIRERVLKEAVPL